MKSYPAGSVDHVTNARSQAAVQLRQQPLGAADTRDVDPEVVVAEDLLRRLAAECHSLRAPLRHSNTMPVPLAGEDETSRQTVLPAEDAERLRRSVRIPHVHLGRALDRCAKELQLPHAFGVRRIDVLGL